MAANDTLVSCTMLERARKSPSRRRIKLDRSHDIPYLAGYSRDGKTIYIDRDLPKTFTTRGRRVKVDRYLIMHEAVEKTLIDQLGLLYQHAHQIALRAEEALVRAAGVSWKDYDNFMQKFIKEVEDTIEKLPLDLDIKPYRDEHDTKLLHRMQAAMKQAKGVKKVRVVHVLPHRRRKKVAAPAAWRWWWRNHRKSGDGHCLR